MWGASRMASEFNFVYSCDLEAHLSIKVCTLEGNLPKLSYEALLDDPLLQFSGRKQSKVPGIFFLISLNSRYSYGEFINRL